MGESGIYISSGEAGFGVSETSEGPNPTEDQLISAEDHIVQARSHFEEMISALADLDTLTGQQMQGVLKIVNNTREAILKDLGAANKSNRKMEEDLEVEKKRSQWYGIPGPQETIEKVSRIIESFQNAGRERKKGAAVFIMIDPDDLHLFNEKYGHAQGDEFLRLVAGVLKESVRPEDAVHGFLGFGDEMCLVVMDENEEAARNTAKIISERITQKVTEESRVRMGYVDETQDPEGKKNIPAEIKAESSEYFESATVEKEWIPPQELSVTVGMASFSECETFAELKRTASERMTGEKRRKKLNRITDLQQTE